MAGNQEFGTFVGDAWRAFDRLPRRLRNIIAHAPYDYAPVMLLALWGQTRNEDLCARWAIKKIFEDRDEFIARDWGPDDPMIGARPNGWQ